MVISSRLPAVLFLCGVGLAAPHHAENGRPEFGPDGRAGLTPAQIQRLAGGDIVLPKGSVKTSQGTSLIEAAVVFDRPPAEVWRLLSKPEAQDRYLAEVKSVGIVWKTEAENCLEFTVRVMGRTVVYRAVHTFVPSDWYFHWVLDPDFRSDIKELRGFWRLYPFADGRTLARYGSVVKPRLPVPGFIREALARGHLRPALKAVKKYVDSDGVWRLRGTEN